MVPIKKLPTKNYPGIQVGTMSLTMEKKADDVKFFSDMIDEITAKFNVDKDRIYITGLFKGG